MYDHSFELLFPNIFLDSYLLTSSKTPLKVRKIYFNETTGHTVVVWDDGDKTIVHCGENEEFSKYTGFCAALAKKIYGSTSAVQRLIERCGEDSGKKPAKKPVVKQTTVAKEEPKKEEKPLPKKVNISLDATTSNAFATSKPFDQLLKELLDKTGGGGRG